MIFLELLIGFLKVGCFSFGGAYGAIPLIQDVVHAYGWLDTETLTYMIAVSESTPGPLMVNLATYIGSSQAGIPGAIVATLAVILPAFIIILLIMAVMNRVIDNRYVQAVLNGLKPAVIGIVLATGVYMIVTNCVQTAPKLVIDGRAILIALLLVLVIFGVKRVAKKKVSPIQLIAISAVMGMIVYAL